MLPWAVHVLLYLSFLICKLSTEALVYLSFRSIVRINLIIFVYSLEYIISTIAYYYSNRLLWAWSLWPWIYWILSLLFLWWWIATEILYNVLAYPNPQHSIDISGLLTVGKSPSCQKWSLFSHLPKDFHYDSWETINTQADFLCLCFSLFLQWRP